MQKTIKKIIAILISIILLIGITDLDSSVKANHTIKYQGLNVHITKFGIMNDRFFRFPDHSALPTIDSYNSFAPFGDVHDISNRGEAFEKEKEGFIEYYNKKIREKEGNDKNFIKKDDLKGLEGAYFKFFFITDSSLAHEIKNNIEEYSDIDRVYSKIIELMQTPPKDKELGNKTPEEYWDYNIEFPVKAGILEENSSKECMNKYTEGRLISEELYDVSNIIDILKSKDGGRAAAYKALDNCTAGMYTDKNGNIDVCLSVDESNYSYIFIVEDSRKNKGPAAKALGSSSMGMLVDLRSQNFGKAIKGENGTINEDSYKSDYIKLYPKNNPHESVSDKYYDVFNSYKNIDEKKKLEKYQKTIGGEADGKNTVVDNIDEINKTEDEIYSRIPLTYKVNPDSKSKNIAKEISLDKKDYINWVIDTDIDTRELGRIEDFKIVDYIDENLDFLSEDRKKIGSKENGYDVQVTLGDAGPNGDGVIVDSKYYEIEEGDTSGYEEENENQKNKKKAVTVRFKTIEDMGGIEYLKKNELFKDSRLLKDLSGTDSYRKEMAENMIAKFLKKPALFYEFKAVGNNEVRPVYLTSENKYEDIYKKFNDSNYTGEEFRGDFDFSKYEFKVDDRRVRHKNVKLKVNIGTGYGENAEPEKMYENTHRALYTYNGSKVPINKIPENPKVTTGKFKLNKHGLRLDGEAGGLEGAEFIIYRKFKKDGKDDGYIEYMDKNGDFVKYSSKNKPSKKDMKVFTSDKDGNIDIFSLQGSNNMKYSVYDSKKNKTINSVVGNEPVIINNDFKYCAKEVKAPFGYMIDKNNIFKEVNDNRITLDEKSGEYEFDFNDKSDINRNNTDDSHKKYIEEIKVENVERILPHVGGRWLRLMMIVGTMLMAFSIYGIYRKRKFSS